jgi:hypothetical protein
MKFYKYLFFVVIFYFPTFISQAQNFTWMTGTTTPNALGIYGTQGVPSVNNCPGARRDAASWVDLNGNLWLFGGEGYASFSSSPVYLSDLWRYNPITNEWTWMNGAGIGNQPLVNGTAGVPSAAVHPGGLKSASTWVDQSGNLWLFGGYGYYNSTSIPTNPKNNLWKYDITTNQWTWYMGCIGTAANQYGVYGTQGTFSSSNLPGERMGAYTWSDNAGNLWMFGGYGVSTQTQTGGYMNDLWKYNIALNQWAWMKGSQTGPGATGVYGTQGAAAAANTPPGRMGGVTFKDASGNLWLYGAGGLLQSINVERNDLWKYNPTTNNWTWMKGSTAYGQPAGYGTQGVPSSTTDPGARGYPVGWTDAAGDFWIYGGMGIGTSTYTNFYMGDLWKYTVSTNQWTFMNGTSLFGQSGVYGTIGVPAPSNMPGGRQEQVAWTGSNGALWMFGGSSGQGYKSDVWKYDVCYAPSSPTNVTAPANMQLCAGSTATLSASNSTGNIQWFSSPTSTVLLATGNNFVTPTLSNNTTYYLESLTCGPSVSRTAVTLTVYPLPPLNVYGGGICTGNSFTFNPTGASSYTYSSGTAIVSPTATTIYTVAGSSTVGCVSSMIVTVTVGNSLSVSVTGSNVICAGQTLSLSAGGAATYSWNVGPTTNTLAVQPMANVSYTVAGGSGSCITLAVYNVTVKPQPAITINSGAICTGDNFTVNPSGASTYTYLNGGPVVSPVSNTNYSVIGTGTNGCLTTTAAIAHVTVNPLPFVGNTSSSPSVCIGNSVVLSGTGADTYTWSGGVIDNVPFSPSVTTTYTVQGTNTLTGCKSNNVSGVNIIVKHGPAVNVTVSGDTLCASESATLEATGALAYQWDNMTFDPILVVTPTITSTYSVTGTASNGCTTLFAVTLIVNECTGLREIKNENSLIVFPNPTSGMLNVNCNYCNGNELVLVNALGETIFNKKLDKNANEIKLNSQYGVYYYFIRLDGKIIHSGKLLVE